MLPTFDSVSNSIKWSTSAPVPASIPPENTKTLWSNSAIFSDLRTKPPERPSFAPSEPVNVTFLVADEPPANTAFALDLSDVLALTPAPLSERPTEPVTKSTKLLLWLRAWISNEPALMLGVEPICAWVSVAVLISAWPTPTAANKLPAPPPDLARCLVSFSASTLTACVVVIEA